MSKRIEIKIPLRAITILVISILFAGLFAPVYADWYHETGDTGAPGPLPEEWNVIERGVNFIRRQSTTDLGRYSWESAPQWVEACCSNYAPYIYNDTEDYYQVRSGLIGVRLYKSGYAEFWDPDITEVRLYEETWEVQYYDKNRWKVCDTYSPVYSVSEAGTDINITISFITDWPNSGERSFVVNYIFREGHPLKHEITFTSYSSEQYEFRVLQKWAGIVATKVKHDKGEDVITSATTVDSSQFRFLKEDGNLGVHENQRRMYYGFNETTYRYYVLKNHNLKPVEINVHAQGLKADFVFGNWTLTDGESLVIDPATYTTDNPIVDGDVWFEPPDYTKDTAGATFWIYSNFGDPLVRAFIEWPISAIPDEATITNTVFKYECITTSGDSDGHVHEMMGTRPSTNGAQAIYNEAGQGTVYAAPNGFPEQGSDKQVDLGTSADADLKTRLTTGDWFAIGLQIDDEGSYGVAQIVSEDWENGVPDPKPTLYVEYSLPTTVTQTFMSTTTTDGTVCIYTVIQIIIDPITTVTVTSSSYTTTGTTVTTDTDTTETTCDTSVLTSETTTTTCETSVSTSETCETTCLTSESTSTTCETSTITHTTECETTCETSTETSKTTTTTCETSTETSETTTTTCSTDTSISTTTTSLSSTVTLLTFCTTVTCPTSCTTIETTSTLSSTTSTCTTITWTETTTSVSTSVG